MPRLPLDKVKEIEKAELAEDDETLDALLAEERKQRAADVQGEAGWEDLVEDRLAAVFRRQERGRKGTTDERKTVDEVFDQSTLLTLYKLISGGLFETLDYPLSTGKEANVFHATTRGGESLAVKIFRTNTATFRSFMTYISGDPRFQSVRPNRRDLVYAWTQKEFKNLQRMREHGIRVPTPIAYHNNVLVMEFLGAEGTPAPRMRDAPPEDPAAAYAMLKGSIERAWTDAHLVHGDFSEFNVLNQGGELVIIDCAQSVLRRHPMARELLERDLRNLLRWFARYGVREDPKALLAEIAPPEVKMPGGKD